MAIRQKSSTLQTMAKACWAVLVHKMAFNNVKDRHRFCPVGAESWHGWQRQQTGTEGYYDSQDSIARAVFRVIKAIWLQLCDKNLQTRCLRGTTQNRNECRNGVLWGMCPKTKFSGVARTLRWSSKIPNHPWCPFLTFLLLVFLSNENHFIASNGFFLLSAAI